MSTFDSGRAANIGGINVQQRRSSDLAGIRFADNISTPSSANDFVIYRRAGALYLWDGSSETNLGAGGSGAAGTLDTVYDNGKSITVDNGAVVLAGTDEDTAVLNITADGDSAGAGILIANSGSGNDVTGTSSLWSVTAAGVITAAGLTLGDDENITFGASSDATIDWEGSNNVLNIAGAVDFDNAITTQSTLTVAGSAGSDSLTLTAGDAVLSDGSLSITDADDANTFTVTNNTHTTNSATTGGIVEFQSTSLTTGTLLNLELTEGTLNGGEYLRCYDVTAAADVFRVAENGDVTITGAGGADALTITNGDVSMSDGSITLVDADNAASLDLTNNTATTAAVVTLTGSGTFTGTGTSSFVNVEPSGLTTGTALGVTAAALTTGNGIVVTANAATSGSLMHLTSTGTMVTSGRLLELTADSATTATGLVNLTADALTTGTGLVVASESNEVMTSGGLATFTHSASGTTVAAKTNEVVGITSSITESGTSSQDYDVLSITRTSIHDTAGTLTAAGSALKLAVVSTETGATLTDTVIGLEVVMGADGTGDGIDVTTSNTAARALDINVAVTSVPGVDIDGTGVQADNTGLLDVAGNGATAAGGSMLRVSQSGTPAAATSYLVDFDYSGATFTNNPDAIHIASDGTGRALHVTSAGLEAAGSPLVDLESTNAGAVGSVLRLSHQGGSQAASDVSGQIVFLGEDDAAADNIYGQIQSVVVASTAGSERGRLDLLVGAVGADTTQAFRVDHDGTNAIVSAGDGAATGIVSSLGNFDLQLQTGNATTGNITITDGADGNITLTPNGTGAVDIAGKVLHSETTSSGGGAQAVSVNGGVHEITTTGADAISLVDGTEGQVLYVVMVSDGGDGTLTPDNLAGASTITFNDVGDAVTLLFTNSAWTVVGNNGATVA